MALPSSRNTAPIVVWSSRMTSSKEYTVFAAGIAIPICDLTNPVGVERTNQKPSEDISIAATLFRVLDTSVLVKAPMMNLFTVVAFTLTVITSAPLDGREVVLEVVVATALELEAAVVINSLISSAGLEPLHVPVCVTSPLVFHSVHWEFDVTAPYFVFTPLISSRVGPMMFTLAAHIVAYPPLLTGCV